MQPSMRATLWRIMSGYTDRSAFFLNYDETTGGYQMADNECFISGKDKATGFPVIAGKFVPFDAKPGTPQAAENLELLLSDKTF